MNIEQFKSAILSVCPEASFDEDNYGQIIVYTNLSEKDGEAVQFEESKTEA